MAQRKKIKAFTVPKTAKTKATIKRNAGTSPLLKVPIEVQENIFTNLLGDRDIHIKFKYKYTGGSEFAARGDLPSETLNALRTCRQIYTIANPVFWSTNTFGFDQPRTFTKWLKIRTANEKRSLRSIALTQDLDIAQTLKLRDLDIKYLTGLRHLHLTFHHYIQGFMFEECKQKHGSIDQMFSVTMNGSDKLALLPLKTVEITLNARFHAGLRNSSQDERDEFVGMVKRMLLDTDPVGTKARLEAERLEHGTNSGWDNTE